MQRNFYSHIEISALPGIFMEIACCRHGKNHLRKFLGTFREAQEHRNRKILSLLTPSLSLSLDDGGKINMQIYFY